MLFEFRTYTAVPGKLPALSDRFRDGTIPLFEAHGFQIVGFWQSMVGRSFDQLHYLLRWQGLAEMEERWAQLIEDPQWAKLVAETEKDGPLIARIDNEVWYPTEYSPAV